MASTEPKVKVADGEVVDLAVRARRAAEVLATADTRDKNRTLLRMADLLEEHRRILVEANRSELERATTEGVDASKVKRLVFDEAKVDSRIRSLRDIAALPDPVGDLEQMGRMENGITFGRMRVPIGVLLMIYEARPHVTVNGGAMALKSGNAIILKGGSEARICSALIGRLWREALEEAGLPADAIQVVSMSHGEVGHLLSRPDLVDLVIPRGGKALISAVSEQSRVPVIKHFEGNCHVYVGKDADPEMALRIVLDSKLLMPGVCNAAESLLVDYSLLGWVPILVTELRYRGIEVRGCPLTVAKVPDVVPVEDEDFATEYLDMTYSLKVVRGVDEAIAHVSTYGSGHTDAIVTERYSDAQRFLREVDSGVVLVNASTMFCDGASLGMGAEIGISTDKLHARGPMGIRELTSYKFVLYGDGQVMGDAF
ncbi:MAG: glutamate-5-semialdehyde dehydrogenase [bacterium]